MRASSLHACIGVLRNRARTCDVFIGMLVAAAFEGCLQFHRDAGRYRARALYASGIMGAAVLKHCVYA